MKKKIVRLTEEDLVRIVKKVVSEQQWPDPLRRDGCLNSCETDEEKENCLRDAIREVENAGGYTEVENFTLSNTRVYCKWHNTGNIFVSYDYKFNYKDIVGVVAVNGKPVLKDNETDCIIGETTFKNGLIDRNMSKKIGIDPDKAKYYVYNI